MGRDLLSPFGALLAEIRERPPLARPAGRSEPAVSAAYAGPEPDLRIETRVVSGPPRLTPAVGRVLWAASLLIHAVIIVLLVVVPLLRSEALPAPVGGTRAFLVAPASLAAPLPPPPAATAPAVARAAPRPRAQPDPPAPTRFTAPVEVPEPVAAAVAEPGPAPIDLDEGSHAARGEAGGIPGAAGGVPGGVVGGVVSGVPGPAGPAAPLAPVRVGGEIREPKKIRDVSPVYPHLAVAAHVKGTVILECLVSPRGLVTEVKLVRGIPLLNESAVDAVRQWMYTPTLKDGVPVPVILTVTVRFDL